MMGLRSPGIMASVLLALLPGMMTATWVFGPGVLLNVLTATAVAWLTEAVCLRLRGQPVMARLSDHSALLTGWLLALALPPASPIWLVAAGVAAAVGFGKHLYGGLGQNPLNPAMLGYALLLVSAPVSMTTLWLEPWAALGASDALAAWFGQAPDARTGATILNLYRHEFAALTAPEIQNHPMLSESSLGVAAGTEWVALAYALGGLWLLRQRIMTWHAPLGFLIGLLLPAAFFAVDADASTPLSAHLLGGATLFAAFFIVTDPVSGATSPKGRLWFGLGVGVLTYTIRMAGQYPEGVAFAVLLMNFAVPLIDHYTRPRILGRAASVKGSGGIQ